MVQATRYVIDQSATHNLYLN